MKSLLFAFFILLFTQAAANNYFFSSSSGDDARTALEAQNPSTPWKTLDKLNSLQILQPGDSIFFKRGDIFYGRLTAIASGTSNREIVYDAYGTGTHPVISGLTLINTWTQWSPAIYYAQVDMPKLNMVTVNGAVQPMGRYPNSGYLTYTAHTGNTAISGSAISTLPFQAAGAEVVIRKPRWVLDRHRVTAQAGNTLSYSSANEYGENSKYSPVDGNGFFLQAHLGTLDQAGEWYYDESAHRLYMHFGSGTPSSFAVKASTKDTNLSINTYHHLRFNNLGFEGGNVYGAHVIGTNHISFYNCVFRRQGGTALWGSYLSDIAITGCSTTDALNNGIMLEQECNNCTIDRVSVAHSGIIPGAGPSGDVGQEGIFVSGDHIIVQNCQVINTGYTGVNFAGNNILIRHNLIDTFCTVKDDGGGIYTYTGPSNTNRYNDRVVSENIVLNGTGAAAGAYDFPAVRVHGIYIDDYAEQVEIKNNTIAHCGETGIFVHDAHDLGITANTLFDNKTGIFFYEDADKPLALVRKNRLRQNIFFARKDVQLALSLGSLNNDVSLFGDFDSNYYCRPLAEKFLISTQLGSAGPSIDHGYSLPEWRAAYNQDLHSLPAPRQIPAYRINSLAGSNLFANGDFQHNIAGVSSWSPVRNCQPVWIYPGRLDSGALQVSYPLHSDTNKAAYITIDIGSVQAQKNYLLRFSLQGTKDRGSIQVYLRKKGAPYNDLSARKFCALSTARTENELLFSPTAAEKDAFLVFKVNEYDSTLWIDNVKLVEANAAITNPDDFIRFEFNASANSKAINLGSNTYIDAENHSYSGSLVLAPWSSVMLIQNTASVLPVKLSNFSGIKSNKTVRLSWNASTTGPTSGFEIQRAANGKDFVGIGSVPATGPAGTTANYRFTDLQPFAENNFYRLKWVDAGRPAYSQVILVRMNEQRTGLQLSPNPAKNWVWVAYPESLAGKDLLLRIYTASGLEVMKHTDRSGGNPQLVDISSLQAGVYFLEVMGGSAVYNSSLVKQ